MDEIFKKAISKRIEKAKKDLREKIDENKDDLKNIMERHLKNGWYGYEIIRNPFLWRVECLALINQVEKEIKEKGYKLVMNNKYHTIMIIPDIEFSKKTLDCFVGFQDDIQFIQYTLEDQTTNNNKEWKDSMREFKSRVNERLDNMESKINSIWYSPGMPGFF